MAVEMDFVEAIVDGMEEGKTELDEFLYQYEQNSEEMQAAWQRLVGMSQVGAPNSAALVGHCLCVRVRLTSSTCASEHQNNCMRGALQSAEEA